jgi:hypothetical protein|tara:strand:- start:1680 stop:2120 length:441 start_codon:yes stop_codon:yes gene_type:complete
MAYAITTNNTLLSIAANEVEKNELTAINQPHTEIEISEADFIKFKENMEGFTIDGTTITFEENSGPQVINNADELSTYIGDIQDSIKLFIQNANANTQSKTLYTQFVNYKNYLDSFDTTTVTYPINTWEKYCQDNGITYLNLLQLP